MKLFLMLAMLSVVSLVSALAVARPNDGQADPNHELICNSMHESIGSGVSMNQVYRIFRAADGYYIYNQYGGYPSNQEPAQLRVVRELSRGADGTVTLLTQPFVDLWVKLTLKDDALVSARVEQGLEGSFFALCD